MNAERRVQAPPTVPVSFIPKRWVPAIVRPHGVDRHNWEACLLHEARGVLRAGDMRGDETPRAWRKFPSKRGDNIKTGILYACDVRSSM